MLQSTLCTADAVRTHAYSIACIAPTPLRRERNRRTALPGAQVARPQLLIQSKPSALHMTAFAYSYIAFLSPHRSPVHKHPTDELIQIACPAQASLAIRQRITPAPLSLLRGTVLPCLLLLALLLLLLESSKTRLTDLR